jgi:hypothetical protein
MSNKKSKIYISGQISGLPIEEAMINFDKAQTDLISLGLDVVNPMVLPEHEAIAKLPLSESERWVLHMKVDIKALMDCDSIYMLNNYKQSKGAMIEFSTALQFGYKVLFEADYDFEYDAPMTC